MSEETEEEQSESVEKKWISGIEAFGRFDKNAAELRKLAKDKKIRSRKMNGRDEYFVEDLEKLPTEDSSPDPQAEMVRAMADLVRASQDGMAKSQAHEEKMFEKYMAGYTKLFDTMTKSIDEQNSHIIELEKQALNMREATEKVFNLEHERKMSELREERTRTMQGKALEMLQKTVAPWVAAKMGGVMPGVGPSATEQAVDPRFTQLGQHVVNMVCQMTDEQFTQLGKVIPAEEFSVLMMIRESFKESQKGEGHGN